MSARPAVQDNFSERPLSAGAQRKSTKPYESPKEVIGLAKEKKSKESTKENKENLHCFLRLYYVQPFFIFGYAESLTFAIVLRTRSWNE